MAKYSKKQLKEIEGNAKNAGLEKFRHYATPHGYYMLESTYGVRVLIHHNKKSQCEAVDAVAEKTGEKGWIVNMAIGQRRFVTEKGGYKVL